jgi:Protein of unknown function (DUF1360)
VIEEYSPHEHKPLLGYAALSAAFNGLAATYVAEHRRSGRRWPERFPLGDFALMAAATFKLSRLISKDKVTSSFRSPFTRFKGEAGPSEVEEEARGQGLQLAIGELLVCPYCVGQWVAAGFVAGYARDRDATRSAAAVFALLAASDFLQQAWSAVDKRA